MGWIDHHIKIKVKIKKLRWFHKLAFLGNKKARVKGENETRKMKGIFNNPINNICIVKAIQQCQDITCWALMPPQTISKRRKCLKIK